MKISGILQILICSVFCLTQAFWPHNAHARSSFLQDLPSKNSPSEYIIQHFPDQELITVRLLGGVLKPGVYRIPTDTSLTSLLSLSGGLTSDSDGERITVSGKKERKIHVSVEDILSDSQSRDIPLEENDIVMIDAREPFWNRDTVVTVTLISTVATIVLTGLLISQEASEN